MELAEILNQEAGLISGSVFTIPNRNFMPPGLFATAIKGASLHLLTESRFNNEIVGSSISFSYEHSLRASVGEFVERYCANFYNPGDCLTGSYEALSATHNLMHPATVRIFADWQYEQPTDVFPFRRLGVTDVIRWMKAYDYLRRQPIYVPLFLVFMQASGNDRYFAPHTSTGLAAGATPEKAITGGLLEAAERHAFTYFWYHQQHEPFLKYRPETILAEYGDDPEVRQLFANKRIRVVIYDLHAYTPFETILILMYFTYKGQSYQCIGCACRFDKREALKKAMLEVYQGVEFCLHKKSNEWKLDSPADLHLIDSFEKCAMYYNHYPEKRLDVPLLRDASVGEDGFAERIVHKASGVSRLDPRELLQHGITDLYTIRLTTPDVAQIGYESYRVITPHFSLLSGMHPWPFLGNADFDPDPANLFLHYPHPFP